MKYAKGDRRKMRRHRAVFDSTEERDRFLAEKFPDLKLDKASVYKLDHGGQLSVWLHTVVWTEPYGS